MCRSTALANGTPTQRQAFVPQPVVGRTPAQLRGYIEGLDPISNRPVMQEIIEGLANPLNDNDLKDMSFERSTPRLLPPSGEADLEQLFMDNRWTDFQPIVLPTEARVAAMLAGTSHGPDETVGQLRPTFFREAWESTVEKVAVNAVMAGARPEYFPVILALAASGITARQSSTNSFGMITVVNGPIRHEIGMNCGIGAMGPYNHANATIGRAYGLLSQNLQGGSVPGDTYMGSLGNWYAQGATFAENEEASPWTPLHVQKGFKPEDSTVSIFVGGWYTQAGYGPRETWREKLRRTFRACEPYQPPVFVMDPLSARGFVAEGFDSKEKLIEWCAENAEMPAREYWDDLWVQTLLRPHAVAGVEPYASRLKAAPDELVKLWQPEQINIVVTGGETQPAWKMFGGAWRNSTFSVDSWR
ncbi:MAG: UGSC family (seleno)protein [Alphaproteobacteria bacterium]|nr:UGSC family (seleno)protein [Alphaproteobacteria bacterium]